VLSTGLCAPKNPNGVACTANNQCTAGSCALADGVCCDSACNDGCHGCALPGTVGTCTTRFTEFNPSLGSAFESVPIVVGADNNLWFLEEGPPSRMGRITTAGIISEFSVGTVERASLALGADNSVWYNDSTDDPNFVVFRVNTSGTSLSTFFPPPAGLFGTGFMFFEGGGTWVVQVDQSGGTAHEIVQLNSLLTVNRTVGLNFVPVMFAHGPDGNLWITGPNQVVRVSTNNVVTPFPVSGVNVFSGITGGPDGNIWFTEPGNNRIGSITTSGTGLREFTIPTAGGVPGRMGSGPGGAVWFIEPSTTNPRLGRITTSGVITECPFTTSRQNQPGELVIGPDQNVWFTGITTVGTGVKIYRFRP
jgi:virginiamycin B lyase